MKKVAFHGSYGGFNLSAEAIQWLIKQGVENLEFLVKGGDPTTIYGGERYLSRDNPILIRCIETLGDRAGKNLKIAEVDTPEFHISEYDGWETVRPAIRVNGKKYALIDEDTDE